MMNLRYKIMSESMLKLTCMNKQIDMTFTSCINSRILYKWGGDTVQVQFGTLDNSNE